MLAATAWVVWGCVEVTQASQSLFLPAGPEIGQAQGPFGVVARRRAETGAVTGAVKGFEKKGAARSTISISSQLASVRAARDARRLKLSRGWMAAQARLEAGPDGDWGVEGGVVGDCGRNRSSTDSLKFFHNIDVQWVQEEAFGQLPAVKGEGDPEKTAQPGAGAGTGGVLRPSGVFFEQPSSGKNGGGAGAESGGLGRQQGFLLEKVYLPDLGASQPEWKKNWFLTWSDARLEAPLEAVRYTHQVFSVDDPDHAPHKRIAGDLRPFWAWSEPLAVPQASHPVRRWMIPLTELFKSNPALRGYEPSFEEDQVLSLEFQMKEGGSRGERPVHSLDLHWQVAQPLRPLTLAPLALAPAARFKVIKDGTDLFRSKPPNRPAFVQQFYKAGATVYEEELLNPNPRTLRVWVQARPGAESSQSLALLTYLGQDVYTPSARGPQGPQLKQHVSRAPLEVDELRVLGAAGQLQQVFAVQGQAWVAFAIRAQEKLRLRWMTHATGLPLCQIPSKDLAVEFLWSEKFNGINNWIPAFGGKGGIDLPVRNGVVEHRQKLLENWNIDAMAVQGRFTREIRLTFPTTPLPRATVAEFTKNGSKASQSKELLLREVQRVATSEIPVVVEYGTKLEAAPAEFSCQGFF